MTEGDGLVPTPGDTQAYRNHVARRTKQFEGWIAERDAADAKAERIARAAEAEERVARRMVFFCVLFPAVTLVIAILVWVFVP